VSGNGTEGAQGGVLIRPSYWSWLIPCVIVASPVWRILRLDYGAIRGGAPPIPIHGFIELNAMDMLLIASVAWLAICRFGVKLTEAGVESRGFLGRRHQVAWEDVQAVDSSLGTIRLSSARDTVVIQQGIFGYRQLHLVAIMKSRVPWAIWPLPVSVQRCPVPKAVPGD
jgi:hypothetical protein